MNSVNIIGRLSKQAELRYSTTGTAVATFTVAVNRIGKDEADFINCVAFKKTAENLTNYTDKGSQVGVSGSIQVRSYEKDGQKRWVTEVIAHNVQFLDSKKKETTPKQQTREDNDPFKGNGQIDIDDSDLPF